MTSLFTQLALKARHKRSSAHRSQSKGSLVNKIRSIVAATILVCGSNAALAYCPNTGSNLHAGYINGMLTSFEDASKNLFHIEDELGPLLLTQGHDTEWELYFNQDEDTREQLKEVLYQKLEDEGFFKAMKIFITLINSKVDSISLENLPFVGVETKAQLEAAIKNWIKRQYAELESLILEAADTPYAGDADVGNAVAAIHAEIINECRKILLIPHHRVISTPMPSGRAFTQSRSTSTGWTSSAFSGSSGWALRPVASGMIWPPGSTAQISASTSITRVTSSR